MGLNEKDLNEVRQWCDSQGFSFVDAFYEPNGWIKVFYLLDNEQLQSVSILLRASEVIVYPN